MIVGTILLWGGSIVTMCVFWWCIKCYFGNGFATFITVILIAIILVSLNSILNEPTPEYERQRRDKGR